MNGRQGVDFLNDFDQLAQAYKGRSTVDKDRLAALCEQYGFHPRGTDLFILCLLLRRSKEEDQALGKKLMYTLSAMGNEEATIRIMSHALLGYKHTPQVLKASEILYTRGHLQKLAREGRNYRAMVLEGKVAYALGDETYAIQLWDQAISACVAESELEAAMRRQNRMHELAARLVEKQRDLSELSTPWIELTLVHYERYERLYKRNEIGAALAELEKARSAMEIGCEQDDPTSHYHAAAFFSEVDEGGSTRYTSTWLYHMSKAGATGHVKAAHALAEFYARSGWKYIEDEPPDHLKPTPFDSYPASSFAGSGSGLLSTLKQMAGLAPKRTSSLEAARNDIFHTAIFPSTPVDRWNLAFRWLETAMKQMYAPSYLLAAKMLLEETLWSQAQAPREAINMTDKRYTYASREDYEAGIPIDRGETTPSSASDATSEDIPNPGYDPTANPLEAQAYLKQIFYADIAHKRRQLIISRTRDAMRKRKLSGVVEEDELADSEAAADEAPAWVRPWLLANSFVRDMWEEEIERLVKEARRLCEVHGWDLVDEEGGLVYKSGLGKGKEGGG